MRIKATKLNLAALGLTAKGKGKAKKVKVSEKDFQTLVISLAHLYGFRVAHFRKVKVMRHDRSFY
uniref:hypothetical protein n=1 Tax=Caballeronia sp. GAFFF3 TaxID=2921759 RepID=UPI0020277BCC